MTEPASNTRNSLVRRSNDTDLMPPPTKRIKRPKNVIDEESYTNALSEIIARDFFPGLLETETQQEYLDALESQNKAWISSAGRRLEQLMTPGRQQGRRGTSMKTSLQISDTPRVFVGETPGSAISQTSASTDSLERPHIDTNISLDSFQAKYTSEDNESFYKLLDAQNRKRADKYSWMWSGSNKMPSKMMLKQREIESQLLQSRESLLDDGGGKKDRLAIRGVSDKPAMPDSWKSKPDNGLMFAPEGVEDAIETVAQRAQDKSRAGPKSVTYSNTRLPPLSDPMETSNVPSSPSLSAVRSALVGKRINLESKSENGAQTPRVNGYTFVDDEVEPEPDPEQTPRTIDLGKGDLAKNPFMIKDQSRREDLHHRLVDKHARTKRELQKNGIKGKSDPIPIPKFPSSPRVAGGQLSPAAQQLWSRVGSNGQSTSAFGVGTSQTPRIGSRLRARWTPSGG